MNLLCLLGFHRWIGFDWRSGIRCLNPNRGTLGIMWTCNRCWCIWRGPPKARAVLQEDFTFKIEEG